MIKNDTELLVVFREMLDDLKHRFCMARNEERKELYQCLGNSARRIIKKIEKKIKEG